MNNDNDLNLVTLKRGAEQVGCSVSFIKLLQREGRLRKYRINTTVLFSLREFEKIAVIETK